ncbi:MAG TPA: heterodisulfide reductase-related iron-sulfur binding cluster [Phycisphaerae bacterium]|nr:heterodisulfide reductase-related iron-sulfur binding cluster [Phycisphaerae bacterium]
MPPRSLPQLPAETYAKFNACIHCGLCLPACPTYVETLDEADSPRGRIHLMKALVDGRVQPTERAFEHLDRCLVCRACETACPSGVVYHELIEEVRPRVAEAVLGEGRRMRSRTLQWMVEHVLPYPKRAGAAMSPLNLARKVGLGGTARKVAGWMSGALGDMAGMVGEEARGEAALASFTPALGAHRGSVVLLRGCVGSLLSGAVNGAAVKVLVANGFDVHVLAEEPCCGALAAHANDPEGARRFGEKMAAVLAASGDVPVISAIAGCGAQLKGLGHVVGTEQAKAAAGRVRDVLEFLVEVGIRLPKNARAAGGTKRVVTYHDPCHLVHGQRISGAPRALLGMIPGLTVVELEESELCCGAAGTYVLNQPEMAAALGRRKAGRIVESGAMEVATANIGCALQIARHLKEAGRGEVRVRHVVELLSQIV